jgi:uncharacterized Tic20 family protein
MTDATDPSTASSGTPTRWWLARPGMKPLGPFAWPELIATVRRSGGVSDWMACPEGGAEWKSLASDPAIVAAISPPPVPTPPLSPQGFPPPVEPYPPGAASAGTNGNGGILVLLHVSGVIDCLLWPVGLILALVLWLSNRLDPVIDAHGKEVMNWKIFTAIVCVAALPLACIYIGVLVWIVMWVLTLVYGIIGAVKASNGELIRYPMFFRLIK